MILITGATGHLGTATIEFLLNKGFSANNIRALVRDESKAAVLREKGVQIAKGDYGDLQSLLDAFEGVEKIFLISSNDHFKRLEHHQNVIFAAEASGVKHLVYTSLTRKTEDGSSPIAMITGPTIETEDIIRKSGIAYTILKNALYADVVPALIGYDVLKGGIYFPAGEGKASFTCRHDLAETSANVLTGKGHEGKTYVLASPINYSFHDLADILSSISGKTVQYISPSAEEYVQAMTRAGISAEYLSYFKNFAAAIKENEFRTASTDLPALLNREPMRMEVFLQQVYGKN